MTRNLTAEKSLDRYVDHDGKLEENVLNVETDIDLLLQKVRFMEEMFPDCVVMLCNATHKNFRYISENFSDIFGHSVAHFSDISSQDFFAEIHADDIAPLGSCYDFMVRNVEGLNAREVMDMRFKMHYRFRHALGHYIFVEDEKFFMESRQGKHIGITLLKDVTKQKNVAGVKLKFYKRLKKRFVQIDEYSPVQSNPVSSREADIIELTKEGFGNQEIAERLSISIHTVKNHKKSLFRKMQVKSSLALARS